MTTEPTPDDALMARVRNGDDDALSVLAERYDLSFGMATDLAHGRMTLSDALIARYEPMTMIPQPDDSVVFEWVPPTDPTR